MNNLCIITGKTSEEPKNKPESYQRNISSVISSEEVSNALGIPDRIESDKTGNESWIYHDIPADKIELALNNQNKILIIKDSPFNPGYIIRKQVFSVIFYFNADKNVVDFNIRQENLL